LAEAVSAAEPAGARVVDEPQGRIAFLELTRA
jgi:hypothetical protein